MGDWEKLTPARLLYVTLCLAHQARLHSQVLQAAAADKDVSGLGASAGALSPLDRAGLALSEQGGRPGFLRIHAQVWFPLPLTPSSCLRCSPFLPSAPSAFTFRWILPGPVQSHSSYSHVSRHLESNLGTHLACTELGFSHSVSNRPIAPQAP